MIGWKTKETIIAYLFDVKFKYIAFVNEGNLEKETLIQFLQVTRQWVVLSLTTRCVITFWNIENIFKHGAFINFMVLVEVRRQLFMQRGC